MGCRQGTDPRRRHTHPSGPLEQDPGCGHRSAGCSGCGRAGDVRGLEKTPAAAPPPPPELPPAQGAAGTPGDTPVPEQIFIPVGARERSRPGSAGVLGLPGCPRAGGTMAGLSSGAVPVPPALLLPRPVPLAP